ncbi:MAG TPA: hypothetical protein VJA65_02130 [bacterium]|nr:hypothetical protein [bacterium]
MKRSTVFAAVAAILVALFAVTGVLAQTPNLRQELRTAITHAGFAANGQAVNYVRTHLGHTLNCLQGPSGAQFNRAIGHVCQGQGNGILADLKSVPAGRAFELVARSAESLAIAGIRSSQIDEMKHAAGGVAALLDVIAAGLR